jgi:hypothetical protein
MEQHIVAVAFWCAAACLLIAVVLLARQRQITARLRGHNAQLEDELRIRDDETRHLAATRLPALIEALYGRPVEVPGLAHRRLSGTPFDRNLQQVAALFAESTEQAKARADRSAMATLKATMRSVQSLANEQQLAISEMQDRHDNPDVLEDLLKIDHMNAQLGRRAQATAVLCGSWPGQQRSASSLTNVVRGATSRIRDYLRVQVNTQLNVGVASRAVEPVVLALAELLDNGARHSQPNTSVDVNFQAAHNGMAIVIDDAGVAMDTEELQHAAALLSGLQSVDINRLGDPPRVGFAVVGVLAARYGFKVSVDTRSPYGGVRAVVFLPNGLLTPIDEQREFATAGRTGGAGTGSDRAAAGTAGRVPAVGGPATPITQNASTMPETAPRTPTHAPAAERPLTRPAERPVTERPVTERPAADRPVAPAAERALTASGLPKRSRVRPADEQQPTTAGPATPATPAGQAADGDGLPVRPSRETAAGMGAWQRGTRSGRATTPSEGEGDPHA